MCTLYWKTIQIKIRSNSRIMQSYSVQARPSTLKNQSSPHHQFRTYLNHHQIIITNLIQLNICRIFGWSSTPWFSVWNKRSFCLFRSDQNLVVLVFFFELHFSTKFNYFISTYFQIKFVTKFNQFLQLEYLFILKFIQEIYSSPNRSKGLSKFYTKLNPPIIY